MGELTPACSARRRADRGTYIYGAQTDYPGLGPLEPRSIDQYIHCGALLKFFQRIPEGYGAADAKMYLDQFEGYLEQSELFVTIDTASDLWELGESLATDSNAVLDAHSAERVRKLTNDMWKVLFAEAGRKFAFVAGDRRLPIDKLLGNVGKLFGEGVFVKLPEVAQYDFGESGRAIAFGMPTGAAFFLLRGTESVLRDFYQKVVKQKRVDPLLWGPMVAHLRRRKKRPPEAMLDGLDAIRKNFRNPTQHPEKTYDIDEAQDLFGLCVDAVNRMTAYVHA